MPIRPEMRDRYPADWPLRSRFVREVRAKGRCERCRVRNGETVLRRGDRFMRPHDPAVYDAETGGFVAFSAPFGDWKPVKIVLTTAHVHDSRPEAASLLNLAAWCQRCHLRHDAAQHAATRRRNRERRIGYRSLFPP